MLRSIIGLLKFKMFALCLLSALLLSLAFPKTNLWFFSWFGLVPLLFALENQKPLKSFGIGTLCGVIFFGICIYWLMYVTVAGMIMMVLYLSLYFGIFAVFTTIFSKKSQLVRLLVLPSCWVVLEFIRAHFLTGFGWANLGESQYQNYFMIQIADITGVYGMSFVVVMTNVWLKEAIEEIVKSRGINWKKFLTKSTAVLLCSLLFCFSYSVFHLAKAYRDKPTVITVGVVQGNVEQKIKWVSSAWPSILYRYTTLTKKLFSYNVDLIIWPETAYPGFVWETPDWMNNLRNSMSKRMTPLLLGAVTKEKEKYFNSAFYLKDERFIKQKLMQHNKLHLVPFGEFVPLRSIFPFLANIVPIDDFSPGEEYTLFPILSRNGDHYKDGGRKFAVLICFEDTFAYLARRFAQKGANMFINITNDAWFMDTKAPYMHLQSSVFRSIENRKSMIRAANTGLSAVIDPYGRVTAYLQGENGRKTFVSGIMKANVEVNNKMTFYTKFGDIFTYLCFGCILVCMLRTKRKVRKSLLL